MNDKLKKEILNDIRNTGFPCELKISSLLRKENWNVYQNGTFYDYEFKISREYDIQARKIFCYKDEVNYYYFAINLIIEVKKSSKKPWVIFTVPYNKKYYVDFKGPGFGQILYSENFSIDKLSAVDLMKKFPRNEESSIGISYYEAFKSPSEPSKIYEAIISSIKSTFYARCVEASEDEASIKKFKYTKDKKFYPFKIQSLEVYMPIIILEGLLCQAVLLNDGSIKLSEGKYVPLLFSHKVEPYNNYHSYYPELVHLDYFSDFLERICQWGNSVVINWKKNKK